MFLFFFFFIIYGHFCFFFFSSRRRHTRYWRDWSSDVCSSDLDDVRPVATSAIRDATNQADFLAAARKRSGLEIEVLAPEEEARYGYLAAVNSTTLDDGVALDLGGGSLQLSEVRGREALAMRSWPLGSVRMTERFLPGDKVKGKQLKALRAHLAEELGSAKWL